MYLDHESWDAVSTSHMTRLVLGGRGNPRSVERSFFSLRLLPIPAEVWQATEFDYKCRFECPGWTNEDSMIQRAWVDVHTCT